MLIHKDGFATDNRRLLIPLQLLHWTHIGAYFLCQFKVVVGNDGFVVHFGLQIGCIRQYWIIVQPWILLKDPDSRGQDRLVHIELVVPQIGKLHRPIAMHVARENPLFAVDIGLNIQHGLHGCQFLRELLLLALVTVLTIQHGVEARQRRCLHGVTVCVLGWRC